ENGVLCMVVQRRDQSRGPVTQVGDPTRKARTFHESPGRFEKSGAGGRAFAPDLQRRLEGQLGLCAIYQSGVCASDERDEAVIAPRFYRHRRSRGRTSRIRHWSARYQCGPAEDRRTPYYLRNSDWIGKTALS